ncbi:MAG: acyl-CoA thioesterase [Anaerolineales bacterium]|nr:acyl-CoA thioesterase [Anaerolineales bacterium]
MDDFRFYHPIEVRYGDLDPQGHVNNARFLTYLEQARIAYVRQLGLWQGGSFLELGVILADVNITFKAPILWGQPIQVGVRTVRLGNKSFHMQYVINDRETLKVHAIARTVQVAYDYQCAATMPIPASWRQALADFESIPLQEDK